ncbi:MAG: IS630 family transposase [Bacteriovoracales bacterium]|nr:IS630 family transposase [Bacteriovoracales bacterium]
MGARRIFRLSDCDRKTVARIVKKGKGGRIVSRAIILKMKDKNFTHAESADVAEVTPRTVINICNNYENAGLDSALGDESRFGRPIEFDDGVKAKIVAMTCSDPPEGFDRWTLELLQKQSIERGFTDSISKEKIRILLKEHDLKPWRQQMWCIPKMDEKYIERMEKILDIYERGDSKEVPLVCLDEKAVFLRSDSKEAILMEEGNPKKVDYEYKRNGKSNVFFAVEPFGGVYTAVVTDRRTKNDFAHFIKELSEKYRLAKEIILVMDNLNTHNRSSLVETFGKKEGDRIWNRFKVYYTPTHASWLNMAEIAIGMYSRQCLGRTRIPDAETLRRKTQHWERYINEKGVTINWTFSKKIAREKMNY